MKTLKIHLFTLFIVFAFSFKGNAQDPNFSQFLNNPVYYNPALAAINGGYTFRSHARNLWAPIPGRFNTFAVSFEAEVVPKLGVAVQAFSDVAGEALLRTNGGHMSYAYRPIETKNFMIQFGVNAGFINKSIDWSKLRFSDQYDESLGEIGNSKFIAPNYNNVTYIDFGSGICARFNHESKKGKAYKKLVSTFGFSVMHLNQPSDAFFNQNRFLPMKYVFMGNTTLLLNTTIISPAVIYERQQDFQTFTVGMSYVKNPLIIGIYFRNQTSYNNRASFDSFILSLGLNTPLKKEQHLKITYSIDFTLSQLRPSSFGSHELSLIYSWNNRYLFKNYQSKRGRRQRYQCPKDFMGI